MSINNYTQFFIKVSSFIDLSAKNMYLLVAKIFFEMGSLRIKLKFMKNQLTSALLLVLMN